jgi:SAM-dependent methyltransferase
MTEPPTRNPSVIRTLRQWWKDQLSEDGFLGTLRRFLAILWQFARESTPAQRGQRFGDIDYDWDYRVDTTSANVAWQDRLLGLFHSPYQPTDPALFHEMLSALPISVPDRSHPEVPAFSPAGRGISRVSRTESFSDFTFIDIGSGKGRVLLMASDYPFRQILGVELLPALHRIAQENIRKYTSPSQQCFAIESICGDARDFEFPPDPTVLYLFNPLPEAGLLELLNSLERSLREHHRPLYALYHNPQLEHTLERRTRLRKITGKEQYSIYAVIP